LDFIILSIFWFTHSTWLGNNACHKKMSEITAAPIATATPTGGIGRVTNSTIDAIALTPEARRSTFRLGLRISSTIHLSPTQLAGNEISPEQPMVGFNRNATKGYVSSDAVS
jgi:hypothetical protein